MHTPKLGEVKQLALMAQPVSGEVPSESRQLAAVGLESRQLAAVGVGAEGVSLFLHQPTERGPRDLPPKAGTLGCQFWNQESELGDMSFQSPKQMATDTYFLKVS